MDKTLDRFNTEQIELLREVIDDIDDAVVKLLLERSHIVKQIHRLKRIDNLQIEDKGREQKIVSRLQSLCPELNSEMVAEIYEIIFSAHK